MARTPKVYRLTSTNLVEMNNLLQQVQQDMDAALGTNQSLNAKGRPIKNLGSATSTNDAALHGSIPKVGGSIVAQTNFDMSPSAGNSPEYASSNHVHGTPTTSTVTSVATTAAKKVSQGSWPVGSVMPTAVNTNPNTLVGFGTWTSLGTQTIGSTTVYYWKRGS
jgi:hypothetical protein